MAAVLAAEAPHARLRFTAEHAGSWSTALTSMTNIDLLVMPHGFTDGLSHHDLYSDKWVCLVSADNADVGDELTIEHLRDDALGGDLPRADRGDPGVPADADARHRTATSRW